MGRLGLWLLSAAGLSGHSAAFRMIAPQGVQDSTRAASWGSGQVNRANTPRADTHHHVMPRFGNQTDTTSHAGSLVRTTTTPQPGNWNATATASTTMTTASVPSCITLGPVDTITVWVVVHTETVTVDVNSTYSLPFTPIDVPTYCVGIGSVPPATITYPDLEIPALSTPSGMDPEYPVEPIMPTAPDQEQESGSLQFITATKTGSFPDLHRPVVTFTTTDKNPAVETRDAVPNFVQPLPGDGMGMPQYLPGDNSNALGNDSDDEADDNSRNRPTALGSSGPKPPITVSADPTKVIINHSTFHPGLGQSTVVVVDHNTFSIRPSVIIGDGVTITRPPALGNAVSVAQPTEVVVGGEAVRLTGSQAVVAGHTMDIPSQAMTSRIDSRDVVIQPGAIIIGQETFSFAVTEIPQPSSAIVIAGQTLAVLEPGVLDLSGTSITYGPGTPETTVDLDGTAVVVGPSWVAADATTLTLPFQAAVVTTIEPTGTPSGSPGRQTAPARPNMNNDDDEDEDEDEEMINVNGEPEDDDENAASAALPHYAALSAFVVFIGVAMVL